MIKENIEADHVAGENSNVSHLMDISANDAAKQLIEIFLDKDVPHEIVIEAMILINLFIENSVDGCTSLHTLKISPIVVTIIKLV